MPYKYALRRLGHFVHKQGKDVERKGKVSPQMVVADFSWLLCLVEKIKSNIRDREKLGKYFFIECDNVEQ